MKNKSNGGFTPILILFLLGLVIFVLVQLASGNAKKEGFFSLFQAPWSSTSSRGAQPVAVVRNETEKPKEPEVPKVIPPQGFAESDLSPYYKKVRLGSVRAPSGPFEMNAEFSLSGDETIGKKGIEITGWTIRTNRGREVRIPRAIEDYNLLAPVAESPIMLGAGQTARFYSWANKQKTPNLRLNKCTGYLNETFSFSPSLPNDCPRLDTSRAVTFSGACQNFIRSLGTCKLPTAAELNQFTSSNEAECRALINTQNFGTCYREHRADADFFSREWRIWVGDYFPFDTQHDRLILLDGERMVVDEYVY